MATTVITKNSSTASAVPVSGDLTQGELAVNVTDKRLFTKNSGGTVVELGTNPASLALPNGTANGVAYLNGSKVVTTGSALNYATGTGTGNLFEVTGGANNVNGQINIQGTDGTNTSFVSLLSGLEPTNLPSLFFSNGLRFSLATNKAASGYSEQMRLTSTGLGIGTSSPGAKLELYTAGTINLRLNGSLGGGNTVDFYNYIPAVSNDGFSIAIGGTNRLSMTNSGNLGLGVTPSAWLSSLKVQQIGASLSLWGTSSGSNNAGIESNSYVNTSGNSIYISSSQYATRYQQYLGQHIWYNAPSGTAGNAITFTQAMTLDSSGNLLVGKTSAGISVGVQLENGGGSSFIRSSSSNSDLNLYVYSTGAAAARFYVGMGGTVYATSTTITGISDQRLKENIRDLDEGLSTVMALRPRKFDWKEGKGKDIKDDRGFIAQEFETVLPDMVEEWRDPAPEGEEPYKAVNANLIPTLVKAIQEQQAIIEQLKADVAALKGA